MGKDVLMTGDTGLTSSPLADALFKNEYSFCAFDFTSPQIKGEFAVRPRCLNSEIKSIVYPTNQTESFLFGFKATEEDFHFVAENILSPEVRLCFERRQRRIS